mmetsp:Transcript_38361/g.63522  ORF Transcript_38361/g.63522 Transcript_38361/m.63522 type:complete len:348 (+) Transcript_38361:43-1086(+)
MRLAVAVAATMLLAKGSFGNAIHATIMRNSLPMTSPRRQPLRMLAENLESPSECSKPSVKAFLIAQRAAVSPQQQEQQQQRYVGVTPRGSQTGPPSFAQRAKGPFMGLTFIATACVAFWQSNRIYQQRQRDLLADFAATMVAYLGSVPEMSSAIKSFRSQLGPGKYRGKMFVAFANAVASEKSLSVKVIEQVKEVVNLMGFSQDTLTPLYEACAADLQKQPSVLGKLTFIAERATPEAAAKAGLRGRFPTWSAETVSALQQAMLDNLFRDMCRSLPPDAAPPPGADILKLPEADAARLMQEVQQQKKEEAAAKLAEEQAKAKEEELQMAIKKALTKDDALESIDRVD